MLGDFEYFLIEVFIKDVCCTGILPRCIVNYRGSATEWYEALTCNLRSSKNVRMWFAQNVMFSQPGRFAEYLLECPSSEVSQI